MRKLLIVGATAALLLTAGATAFAAGDASSTGAGTGGQSYCVYADYNKDGICDNWDARHQIDGVYCPNQKNPVQQSNTGCAVRQQHHGQALQHDNNDTGRQYGHHGGHGACRTN